VSRLNRILLFRPSPFWSYGVAVLSCIAATIISQWLAPHIGFLGTLFLCVVALSAWYGGVGPCLLATALSSLAFHHHLLQPTHGLGPNPPVTPRLLMYIVSNLLIGLLSAAQRKAKESIIRARDDLQRANEALLAESRERKQTEEALRQAQADLTHATRVTSMGEMSASLAHEVKQPIAAAIIDANTCLRWLSREQPDVEEARAAASRIIVDGKRASEIVDRVRLLFKKDTLQRELVDPNEIIREMVLLIDGEATRYAVFVRTEFAADLPQVMGDRVQLQQVLMNLMMNSIDAMKDVDGTRELTIHSQRGENGQVLISVSDTGVGLPAQEADKIFEAFFTTKPHGTGMGLRISRSIVNSHGGRLWAVDNPPRGARFCFTLPVSRETRDLVATGDRTESADVPSGQQPRR
jgi:C4-dicarboxylate-specific signal transduction histidine kinase